ncbi:hypothetical protein [Empedobacter sp.]|uniref:hypothetical protein n=1 Tax=Empedobacter sp. TaxID=1927715 RepID=UPI0028A0BF68|nr:hypothetical protein [Empedobacter sp.]
MTVKYPTWINKIEGASQTPEEMNGIVEVLQNHAENLSLHDVRILAAASGIYTAALTPTSEVPAEVGDKVFLVTQPGTYTNFGNVVLPENNFGFIFKNGNSFSIQSVEITIPIKGKVEEGNTEAVSGGEVFNTIDPIIKKLGVINEPYNPTRAGGYSEGDVILENGVTFQVKTGQSLLMGEAPSNNPSKVNVIDTGINSVKKLVNNLTELPLILGYGNSSIGSDGGQLSKNTNSRVYYATISGNDKVSIITNVEKFTTSGGRAYAFYTQLPINSTNFISGADYVAENHQFVGEVIAPSNATIVAISVTVDKQYSIAKVVNLLNEVNSLKESDVAIGKRVDATKDDLSLSNKKNNLIKPFYENLDKYTMLDADIVTAEIISFSNSKYRFNKLFKIGSSSNNASGGAKTPRFTVDLKHNTDVTIYGLLYAEDANNGLQYGHTYATSRGYNNPQVETFALTMLANEVNTTVAAINSGGAFTKTLSKGNIVFKDYIPYANGYLFEFKAQLSGLLPADYAHLTVGFSKATQNGSPYGFVYSGGLVVHSGLTNFKYESMNDDSFDSLQLESEKHIGFKQLSYGAGHNLDNIISVFFKKGGSIDTGENHLGKFTTLIGSKWGEVKDSFGVGYKFEMTNGESIPKYVSHSVRNTLIAFNLPTVATTYEKDNATFQFWVNRNDLNGNGLIYHHDSSGDWFLGVEDLLTVGFIETRQQPLSSSDPVFPVFEVIAVEGDYTCVRMYLSVSDTVPNVRLAIYNTSANNVTSLTLYNPTLIYNKNIDPYHYYECSAEKAGSKIIGKNAVAVSDSQWNDRISAIEIIKKTGLNIYCKNNGGHAVKYRTGTADWLYRTELRDAVLAIDNVDYYILQISTNDGTGGGVLTSSDIQAVLDNYPAYGDDSATITSKMALFNAMNATTRQSTFNYLQTYGAYIKQLLQKSPNARLIVCSIPISCSGYLTGAEVGGKGVWASGKNPDVARAELDAGRQKISNETKQIAQYFNAIWVDLLNEVGLTYENFTTYSIDSTHWLEPIKKRIGNAISQDLRKTY